MSMISCWLHETIAGSQGMPCLFQRCSDFAQSFLVFILQRTSLGIQNLWHRQSPCMVSFVSLNQSRRDLSLQYVVYRCRFRFRRPTHTAAAVLLQLFMILCSNRSCERRDYLTANYPWISLFAVQSLFFVLIDSRCVFPVENMQFRPST
jgi:hypothetical protein